ncbi:hypothetical protein RSOLAG1IB_07464 [Rhizoctonia solani AG-1 IB]|uniref:Uncharacterized protein n=1 Tax=Thanatephorus cucumeris (strain AG1-IB / isolate 7/3/14) TaxID=1108050 RepID=A0A0B7FA73_THACB|nr:hypothetical protein RSOLAG1IB_07464 [Rhizoctonia solani AG-1 IB]
MSEPLQLTFGLSLFFRFLHEFVFLSMGPILIAALGAGAFVTTAVAGAILFHRKVLTKSVPADAEKGSEQNALERRETGPGWKEFTEQDDKTATSTSELLLPLFQNQESDITDTLPKAPQAPLDLTPVHPSLLQEGSDPPNSYAQLRIDKPPGPERDISDTHDLHEGPAFPPGLPLPANVAVATPISVLPNRISGLSPLDTGVSRISSWPILAPTPVEEAHDRANGEGGKKHSIQMEEPDIKDDVVPPDELSSSSPQHSESKIAFSNTTVPASVSVRGHDEGDPFADPADSAHSPRSEVVPIIEDVSPAYVSLDKIDDASRTSDTDCPSADDLVPISSVPSVASTHDTVFIVNPPLSESPSLSPKDVSPLLVHTLPLDAIATTTVVFGEELSPWVDVSDQESPSHITAPFAPVLSQIITTLRTDDDINEAPRSPLSDTGSLSSGSESSGPETPTELKHDLPFSAALDISPKGTPELQLGAGLTMQGDDDDEEDDFVMVGQEAPDPPSPIIDDISSEWRTSKLPGSFGEVTAYKSGRSHSDQSSTNTMAVTDVPPLTADMVQMCHAALASGFYLSSGRLVVAGRYEYRYVYHEICCMLSVMSFGSGLLFKWRGGRPLD